MGEARRVGIGRAVLAVLLAGFAPPLCYGQVIFNNIDPGRITMPSIDPHHLRRMPIVKQARPSKPYAPIPRFQNKNILPDHLRTVPIERPNFTWKHMRQNRIHMAPLLQRTIVQQKIHIKPMVHGIQPGRRMPRQAVPVQDPYGFDSGMEGKPKASIYFDSSIHLLPRTHPTSPMTW